MNKCNCYHENYNRPECWGTKERDICSCGGDETKCDFYPNKRAAQVRKVVEGFNGQREEYAYDYGYRDGVIEFAKYLKSHSFLCDSNDSFSFQAINVEDDLDDLVKDFLEMGRNHDK